MRCRFQQAGSDSVFVDLEIDHIPAIGDRVVVYAKNGGPGSVFGGNKVLDVIHIFGPRPHGDPYRGDDVQVVVSKDLD
jgi:hypothetical protein